MYTYYVCIYFYILKVRQYNVYMYYTLYHYLYLYIYICIYMYIYVYILSYIHTSRCPAFAGSCQQNTHSYVTILYLSANYLHCRQLPARARQAHSSAAIWKYCRHMNLYIYIDIYVDRYNDLMYIYNDMIWIHKLPTAARKSRAMRCT